jgi:hypothetical protein
MANNEVFDSYQLSVACSDPATPASGGPVRYGTFTGVALTKEGEGGNVSTEATVDFGPRTWNQSVKAVDGSGNSAVAVGDTIYYVDADTPKLSKKNTGYLFGVALEAIDAGATKTIKVLHIPAGGALGVTNGTLDGAKVANAANANVVGAISIIHRIDITAGALGDTDVTLTYKERVINAWLVLRGAGVANTTLKVCNGANAITDAMAASGADKALVRCASLDDATWEIAAGGTLRVTSETGATQPDATVFVECVRVA